MRRLLLLLALVACGSPPQPAAPPTKVRPPAPRRAHTIQPHELIVRGVPATGVRRAVIARHGDAWLRRDTDPIGSADWQEPDGRVVAVAEVDGERIRVVHEDDDARLLIWIALADLARVTIREVELIPGVVLAPGTPVVARGEAMPIEVAIEGLITRGAVASDALGEMWDAAPPARLDGAAHSIDTGVVIRVAPDAASAVLATTTERVRVRAGATERGWTAVVTVGPQVRVRGYVRDGEATDALSFGTSSGHGYGASHTIDVEVPAGACLYDAIDGALIGVTTATRTRMTRATATPGWLHVLVGSPWALLNVPAHQADDGAFDRCAELTDP